MLFNSFSFLIFFAVVYSLFRILPHRAQNWLLLAASWFFYGYWDIRFLFLLISTTVLDWIIGLLLDDPRLRHRRMFVTISIMVNLGILCVYKYYGFFVREANTALQALGIQHSLPVLSIILPVGMSFYVFQSMAYTIDVYRGTVSATKSFPLFALFISFFPQLVAGPIERADKIIPQHAAVKSPTPEQRASGTQLILWGYFKKMVVADNLAIIVQNVFDTAGTPGGFLTLIAAYAFTWQIYCDFSGYCDIARGLARWFGIDLVINFNLPFFASSPRDLWRRWHISLSQWLRDYLYIPLGGNRMGALRTQFNLLITMLIGGLWHGANWTFIAWGAWHGIALAIQRVMPPVRLGRPGKLLAVIATFHFTCLGFLIFRAHSLTQAGQLFASMATSLRPHTGDLAVLYQVAILAIPVWIIELIQYICDDQEIVMRLWAPLQAAASVVLLLSIIFLGSSYGRQFIYFQF